MGSAISATASDRRVEHKQSIKQDKIEERRIRQFMKKIQHQYGELKYDEKGVPFYINDNDEQVYIDKYGHEHFYDDEGQIYYHDEKGDTFYLDENLEPYYLENDGTKYFLDISGNKYYFDDSGEPYLVVSHEDNTDDAIVNRSDTLSQTGDSRELNKEEMDLRSPVSQSSFQSDMNSNKELTGTRFSLSRRNYRHGNTMKTKNTDDHPEAVITKSSRNSLAADTLSSYSTLSFMRSEYEMVISETPDYIKDTSEESETRVTAQIEAENKILRKALENERRKQTSLPDCKSYNIVGKFNVKIKTDTKDCNIVDAVFISTGNLILADSSNNTIKQFNENLDYVNHLEMDEKPYSVCSGNGDDIVHVTFQTRAYDGIKALKVTASVIFVQNMMTLKSGSPFGITRNNKGLAVVMSTKDGWEIHLMTLNLHVSRVVKLENEDMKRLNSPYYVLVTPDLKIIVSDRGNNSVYIFETNGEIISTYDQLREPLGICSDSKGSLFVVSPGVVHQISETGERIKALMRRDITHFALVTACYDPHDCLFVLAGKSNFVMAFKMK